MDVCFVWGSLLVAFVVCWTPAVLPPPVIPLLGWGREDVLLGIPPCRLLFGDPSLSLLKSPLGAAASLIKIPRHLFFCDILSGGYTRSFLIQYNTVWR